MVNSQKKLQPTYNVYEQQQQQQKTYPKIHKANIDDAEILLYQEMKTYVLWIDRLNRRKSVRYGLNWKAPIIN